jgi:hypothetical protein
MKTTYEHVSQVFMSMGGAKAQQVWAVFRALAKIVVFLGVSLRQN